MTNLGIQRMNEANSDIVSQGYEYFTVGTPDMVRGDVEHLTELGYQTRVVEGGLCTEGNPLLDRQIIYFKR